MSVLYNSKLNIVSIKRIVLNADTFIQYAFYIERGIKMADEIRDFKGVWITKEVWLDTRLSALDKVILTEIDSLDQGERGCYASNKYIAEFCQCSETKVSKSISLLTKLGYVYVQNFDGRQRELKSRLTNNAIQPCKNYKAEMQKVQESNISINTPINTDKKERKNTSYDDILSAVEDDSLRELYYEYIKMRKLIKSPMTDRALRMLIDKVNKLEPRNIDKQKQLLEVAIMNNWKSVYPIKSDNKKVYGANGIEIDPNAPDDLAGIL